MIVPATAGGEQRGARVQTILLVDDDAGVRRSVGDMLKRSGYEVLAAENGTAALDVLDKNSAVDLLIADRRMPGMDGLSLVRRVKERRPALPAVILTGYGDLESYQCATSLGVVRYLGKPIGLRELLQTVRDAVAEGLGAQALQEVRERRQ